MGSSSQQNRFYDVIRKKDVEKGPEEEVRQHLIRQLLQMGYPKGLIAVEKALSELPHLKGKKVPLRRIDILCYSPSLEPYLLIECKAEALTCAAEQQLIGYNSLVGAPYIALVNRKEARCGRYKEGVWDFQAGLIPFLHTGD